MESYCYFNKFLMIQDIRPKKHLSQTFNKTILCQIDLMVFIIYILCSTYYKYKKKSRHISNDLRNTDVIHNSSMAVSFKGSYL